MKHICFSYKGPCQFSLGTPAYPLLRPGFPDTINLGQTSLHSWTVNSTPKNTPTCKTRFPSVSHQLADDQQWTEREIRSYATAWMPQSFLSGPYPSKWSAICSKWGQGHDFFGLRHSVSLLGYFFLSKPLKSIGMTRDQTKSVKHYVVCLCSAGLQGIEMRKSRMSNIEKLSWWGSFFCHILTTLVPLPHFVLFILHILGERVSDWC